MCIAAPFQTRGSGAAEGRREQTQLCGADQLKRCSNRRGRRMLERAHDHLPNDHATLRMTDEHNASVLDVTPELTKLWKVRHRQDLQ